VASDGFAVRWTGQVQPQFSETYQFCTTTNDGLRLWINDLPIIDQWVIQAPTKWCAGAPASLANTGIKPALAHNKCPSAGDWHL
jgi:hypothetical protein